MEYNNSCPFTNKALNHLRECMNVYDEGTPEMNLARKAFAFICNRIRINEKTDAENIMSN